MTIDFFHSVSSQCSRTVTLNYSTSFSSAIRLLHPDLRRPIFDIYGFVRLADEIVDTFHGHDKSGLLAECQAHTWSAIDKGISINPILDAFQQTVNRYDIDRHLIDAFFRSMESDLTEQAYNRQAYEQYIYGSAEVVGLMCLYVFCNGDKAQYNDLKPAAQALGAAFQKVNFLRDIKADFQQLSRMYFPGCNFHDFSAADKASIEDDISKDFDEAYAGILRLPLKARFGVYVAYKYYLSLFQKIKQRQPQLVLQQRVRIPAYHKAYIVMRASVKNRLRLIG